MAARYRMMARLDHGVAFSKGYALQKLCAKRTALAHLDDTQPALS
jgi:hypothetical protein